MKFKALLFLLFVTTIAAAQYNYRDSNRIGIAVGINQFDLNTSDFKTSPSNGWNVGLSVRGNFHNNWDAVYLMQFSELNYNVATIKPSQFIQNYETEYNIKSAQISFQFSYRIIEHHLSFEMGPMVQVNGKAKIDESDEFYLVDGLPGLIAKDLVNINKFSVYPIVGLTAGVKHVRLNVNYQYGITNMLGNLDKSFTGHGSTINGNIIFYL